MRDDEDPPKATQNSHNHKKYFFRRQELSHEVHIKAGRWKKKKTSSWFLREFFDICLCVERRNASEKVKYSHASTIPSYTWSFA